MSQLRRSNAPRKKSRSQKKSASLKNASLKENASPKESPSLKKTALLKKNASPKKSAPLNKMMRSHQDLPSHAESHSHQELPSLPKLRLRVNGRKQAVAVPPMRRLLDTLREDLGLTGTKEGCGEGECGACSVLVDGEVVNSCLVATCQVEGCELTTVEGLAKDDTLDRLQRAFLECGAAQCGICTPGMLLAARALPDDADLEQIRAGLAGNLCRCTGYIKIYDAVAQYLRQRRRKRA